MVFTSFHRPLPKISSHFQSTHRSATSTTTMEVDTFTHHRPVPWYAKFVPIAPDARLKQAPHQAFDAIAQASTLCGICDALGTWAEKHMLKERWYKREDRFAHYKTGAALLRSSKDGCHMCTLIWQSFLRRYPNFDPPAHGLVPAWLQESGEILIEWNWLAWSSDSSDFRICAYAKLTSTSSVGPEEHRLINTISDDKSTRATGSTDNNKSNRYFSGESLSLVHRPTDIEQNTANSSSYPSHINSIYTNSPSFSKHWTDLFQECLSSHQCTGSVSSTLPTRLLDVGPEAGHLLPRLVETESEPISAPYATLSYCWGGKSQLQLTNVSLEVFKLQIPVSQLALTILDAIQVVRKLGIRYLWVDSLCIIQDSKSDWEKEVVTMGEVFRNSSITIAALGANHVEDGLFARRDPLIYQPCKLFQRDGKNFFIAPHVGDAQFADDWLKKSPLHQRGWVMQERALSPRTLNFGATVIWECSKGVKYEHGTGFKSRFGREGNHTNTTTTKSKLHESPRDEFVENQTSSLLQFWKEQILKPYTMTILTVKEDRLAAVSGVIESIGKSCGWASVYGLWIPFLVEELLWQKLVSVPFRRDNWLEQNNKEKLGRVRLRIAPTWSWASVDIKIEFNSSIGKAPVRLFTAQVTVASNTATAWESTIIVKSRLYFSSLPLKARSDLFSFLVDQGNSFQCSILFDIVPYIPGPYYYLPLIAEKFPNWYHAGDEGKIRFAGLILVKSIDTPGTYERVGTCQPYVSKAVADNLLQNELLSVELV